ncbi:uncharacterized protein F5891DRAFT_982967 [Suillus fuscotomentosus]|uniref:Uncharacterized protein n=1 Tax=Suillus fuscotomentosus TaxID=1912939 RepID=A0AAD4DZF2_9AGAM|nr:uncharacterized protein F5891DRAFT_982967 [Suillus fuscotomentosus]KAG1896948.1 hypothetical protein F5891DRAFT_982967 [Suillus fuscotomentosus]
MAMMQIPISSTERIKPRLQERPGRLKRFRLAMTRRPQEAPAPVPVPAPAPPTTSPPVAVTTTVKTHLRHIFSRSPHHATPPVVDVPFAKAKERNAAAGAPGPDPDIVPDEYLDTTEPDPDTQQQRQQHQQPHQQAVAVHIDPGEHGGGKSCVCC